MTETIVHCIVRSSQSPVRPSQTLICTLQFVYCQLIATLLGFFDAAMNVLNNFIFSRSPWIRILRHSLFWLADLTNYYLVMSVSIPLTWLEAARVLYRMPLVIGYTYFILYGILPQLGSAPAGPWRWLGAIGSVVAFAIVVRFVGYYLIDPALDPGRAVTFNIWDFRRVLGELLQNLVVISLAVAIKLIKNKTELQLRNEALTEEKKASELNFLKAQMHPHFLFNVLNTLYAEVLRDGKGREEEIVVRLSGLLRFLLEECDKPTVPIGNEIRMIRDYLALEQLRHGNRLRVELDIEVADESCKISPLLLLPFVENSCKHALSSIQGNLFISISLRQRDNPDRLLLNVANDYDPASELKIANLGLGIANVRRQLDILYGSAYRLDIIQQDSIYHVTLEIPLTNEESPIMHHR